MSNIVHLDAYRLEKMLKEDGFDVKRDGTDKVKMVIKLNKK